MNLSNYNFYICRMIESAYSPTQGLSQLCDSGKQNVEDEFISFIHRNTIQGLKYCKEVLLMFFNSLLKWIINILRSFFFFLQESTFVILATIKHIVADDDWWYTT